jgi:hypothetical protein
MIIQSSIQFESHRGERQDRVSVIFESHSDLIHVKAKEFDGIMNNELPEAIVLLDNNSFSS